MAKNNKPADIKLEDKIEDCCDSDLELTEKCDDCPVVEVAPKIETLSGRFYTAVEGDSYASIAAKHKPAGISTHAHATTLFALNGGKTVTAGTIIKL